jgi:PAS domain-containing protein
MRAVARARTVAGRPGRIALAAEGTAVIRPLRTDPRMGSDPDSSPTAPRADDAVLFRIVVGSALDFAIFTIDESGAITSWNAGAERALGFTCAEIIGRNTDAIFMPED